MEELLNKIKKKNLFFTITTGRSGTYYLSYILGLLKDFRAEHESSPGFHDYYRDILTKKGSFSDFWINYKLPYIASSKESNYADVSHVACKGFFESLMDLGITPNFIFLKRNNREVARSLLELGTIPLRTKLGLKYLSSPYDEGVLQISGRIEELSDYQLCYWYTMEIDRRSNYYEAFFMQHNCPYATLTFKELIDGDPLGELRKSVPLPGLSIGGYLRYWRNKGKVRNQKLYSKRSLDNIDWKSEEEELFRRTSGV